ncbi:ribose-5-phosphate isomerase [Blastococcus jejuensis]|uniref:Ribose-5-phosphate isomerase n=1 Tax=Blastococcus jejuensis TaxID=351224 RepID=A0ABP6NT83_9ACTN
MRIAIAADHNGVGLKRRLIEALRAAGHVVDDRGADEAAGTIDYPPLCEDVCRRVVAGTADRGIVVGGSGQGEVIACNKIAGIRAGLCPDVWHAEISRGNNDANVLVLGAKVIDPDLAEQVVASWLTTPFKGAEHARRVAMIATLERGDSLLG